MMGIIDELIMGVTASSMRVASVAVVGPMSLSIALMRMTMGTPTLWLILRMQNWLFESQR